MIRLLKALLKSINGILFGGAISNLIKRLPRYPSAIVLIFVNLIPIPGVLFWGWDYGYILVIYWVETTIIGLLNIFRMLLAQKADVKGIRINGKKPVIKTKKDFIKFRWNMIIFFMIHFGMFNIGHGLFVFAFANLDFGDFSLTSGNLYQLFVKLSGILIPIFALFLSHLFSFIFNYIGKEEYKDQEINVLFVKPYGRIVITHVTVLLGGLMASVLGSPKYIVVLMVLLKILFDLLSHIFAHENLLDPKINVS